LHFSSVYFPHTDLANVTKAKAKEDVLPNKNRNQAAEITPDI